jgi:amino acid transporter
LAQAAKVIVISSVMFTFISYWRTAAVVLCDLASTAYYIGGIVEHSVGPSAPWFILAVMLFSYAVRAVYIESCSLFVRGGVYRVVKEALGGFLAKLSVSALMFDYILTGPTSAVSAGKYIVELCFFFLKLSLPNAYEALGLGNDDVHKSASNWGAVLLACGVTLYFFRQNLLGIHESSDKALKIMIATTIMAVIILLWCLVTLAVRGPANDIFRMPDLGKKYELKEVPNDNPERYGDVESRWVEGPDGNLLPKLDENGRPIPKMDEALAKVGVEQQADPLGFLGKIFPPEAQEDVRRPHGWLGLLGFLGLAIAFGHSILAMSGEETLAQVYREVESPKLPNFKKAAFIVFVYSLVLTAGISFLAVALIPDEVRMKYFDENLIGGLARYVLGPPAVKLALEAFVVVVGFLILSGAVNTAIIGSNGVLNRVAEDGVLPDWFLKPHPRFGTTYRLLYLITGLQLGTILFSGGDMILLGEAYAFGVVWSFVFKALAMVVLRFKDRSPREYMVPFNVRVGNVELPIGLGLIFLVLFITAILNFFTKEVATVGGIAFTAVFLTVFLVSEHWHEKKRKGTHHHHLEQFNQASAGEITPAALRLARPYRKLVAIRSPHNLFMLEKSLRETDPATTDIVVMTAKIAPVGSTPSQDGDLDVYDQELMTAVVDKAERTGKRVVPLIVPTNNPLYAVLRTARDLNAQEVILGLSNKFTAEEQLDQIALYWFNVHDGKPPPLTVRILSKNRDVYFDLEGGSRIPKISDRQAKSVADLRAAGVGVNRVLLAHDGSPEGNDLFRSVLTLIDPEVSLDLVTVTADGRPVNGDGVIHHDQERAKQLGREVQVRQLPDGDPVTLVRLAQEGQYDLIILPLPKERLTDRGVPWKNGYTDYVLTHAHCLVCLVSQPLIPTHVEG